MKRIQVLVWTLLSTFVLHAQNHADQDFLPPLDIPLKLSGTFGELRSNHFHSGMDIKTGEREGLKVYAIEEGYVSRIKVQSGGYGKALYITHPNGYVSVYGHLSNYNTEIGAYVTKNQYSKQSYELDLYLPPDKFPVERGAIIAFSGNTGRSGGPHLHFEIRTARDQKPVNPLLFNYSVTDKTRPVINVLKIYETSEDPGGIVKSRDVYPVSKNGRYFLKNSDTLEVSGRVYFGINTYDPFNGGINKNGVYGIRLLVDSVEMYGHAMNTFAFDETRYINSLIDYREYKEQRRRVQRSIVDPNNALSIYTNKNSSGLTVEPGRVYNLLYEVRDIHNNTATLEFVVKGRAPAQSKKTDTQTPKSKYFDCRTSNSFKTKDFSITIPAGALYNDLYFKYDVGPAIDGSFSPVHGIHFETTPLHTWCNLSIRPFSFPEPLQSKILIAKVDEAGEYSSCGGAYKNGTVQARIREFGNYCILADTLAPVITPVNIKNGKSLLAQNTIKVKIKDELSGIEDYDAYLGEEWILMEYDAKNDLLIYRFDQILKEGENTFRLIVRDERNNISEYSATLNY